VREGVVADPDGVAEAIKPLLPRRGLMGDNLMVSVTGVRAIPRVLELPRMKEQMLEAAVYREAKREMPVPMEEVCLACEHWVTTKSRVFALGVPATLDPLLRALELATAGPHAVDIKPLALARALTGGKS
jgi:Tfp pilus assembly PilM family ATPase